MNNFNDTPVCQSLYISSGKTAGWQAGEKKWGKNFRIIENGHLGYRLKWYSTSELIDSFVNIGEGVQLLFCVSESVLRYDPWQPIGRYSEREGKMFDSVQKFVPFPVLHPTEKKPNRPFFSDVWSLVPMCLSATFSFLLPKCAKKYGQIHKWPETHKITRRPRPADACTWTVKSQAQSNHNHCQPPASASIDRRLDCQSSGPGSESFRLQLHLWFW